MTKKELTWLVEKAKSFQWPVNWVELGSYCGRSLLAVGSALPAGSTLVSVDASWQDRKDCDINLLTVMQRIERERKGEIKIHAICDTTDGAFETLRQQLFDVVFIDANHSYEFCKRDIENWRNLIELGGTICGHDYDDAWPGVRKAVNELLPGSEVSESIWHHQYSI